MFDNQTDEGPHWLPYSQWGPETVWLPAFFKYLKFSRRKKTTWNDFRVELMMENEFKFLGELSLQVSIMTKLLMNELKMICCVCWLHKQYRCISIN